MAGESFFGEDTTREDQQGGIPADLIPYRSEERRVGKECL